MKKIFLGMIALILLVSGYFIYDASYGGEPYYTQITTDGTKFTSTSDQGEKFIDYRYTLKAYSTEGKERTLTFNGNKDVPLRKTAFLKLKVNRNKGVMGWEEVKQSQLPKKVRTKLLS